MSETTPTTEKKNIIKLPPQEVTRNGITKTLTQFEILHGDNKDKPYLALQVSPETLLNTTDMEGNVIKGDVEMIGIADVVDFLNGILKKTCQVLWFDEDNISEDGQFLMAKFLASVADLTTGGSTLKELRDKIDELTAEQVMLAMSDSSMVDGQFTQEATKRITELSGSIRNYKSKMEKRSKKKDTNPEASVRVG